MRLGTVICCPTLMIFSLLAPSSAFAADGDRTVVHLEIKRGITAWSGMLVDFRQSHEENVIASPGTSRSGSVGGATVLAAPVTGKPGAYHLEIRRGSGEPVMATVAVGEPAIVDVPSPIGILPYQVKLRPDAGPNNSPHEVIGWSANYRAEGTLKVGDCQALMVIWDLTADGVFNRRDFAQGSALGIDLNGDGKLFGREEYPGAEPFRFCGKTFHVDPDSLAADGSAVTVVETSAPKLTMGASIPSFAVTTIDGRTVRSESWKGKVTLLDFWASWCGYCIGGFPILKEMQSTYSPSLEIVSINTDEPAEIDAARKVLGEHDMPWTKVLSGRGVTDPVWMMFAALEERSLPLYVVMDRDGVIRYEGDGGEHLTTLRAAIQKLVSVKPN